METVRHVLNVLLVCLEVVLIFNLLIVVHETGHFLAARWRGLVIEKFGIWFGKPLWKKTINGVQYSLGSIPFGGFVALPQMAPMDAIEGTPEADRKTLPAVGPLDKIIVALAGPVSSFLLAIVFACIVWAVGRPVGQQETTTTIGYVVPGSPAAQAPASVPDVPPGLLPGDKILAVDGHPVHRFMSMSDSVVWYVVRSEGETIPFEVLRDGRELTFYPKPITPPNQSGWRRKALRQVLIDPAYDSMIAKVEPHSPAAKAGLQVNDIVTGFDGHKLYNPLQFFDAESNAYGRPISLTVDRHGTTLALTLPAMPFAVGEVFAGSPAERAGLKKGDDIVTLDGQAATRFADLRALISEHPTAPITLGVLRDQKSLTIRVTPEIPTGEHQPYIGIGNGADGADGIVWDNSGVLDVVHESPVEQIEGSVMSVVNTVGAVIAPKSGIKLQHLGGPLFIFRTYYMLFQSQQGWRMALWFSVILNVNLALLNMLPIPVLDGGHILLALIEAVRRRPANIRVLEVIQTACVVVILSYMAYVTFFDVGDLAGGRASRRELEFSSPAPAGK
jgi:regulator of sigma E protease